MNATPQNQTVPTPHPVAATLHSGEFAPSAPIPGFPAFPGFPTSHPIQNPANPQNSHISHFPDKPLSLSMPRRNDVLGNLTEEQRQILNHWLFEGRTYQQIIEDLAKPPFSISTSDSALSRYRTQAVLAAQLTQANQLTDQLPNPQLSLKNLLHQSALTTALQVELPPATFQILARYYSALSNETFRQRLTEQRDLQIQLARDRYQLDTFKAQYNAAREALDHAAELMAIRANDSLDDPAKIELSRLHLFGANCIPAPAPSKLLPPK